MATNEPICISPESQPSASSCTHVVAAPQPAVQPAVGVAPVSELSPPRKIPAVNFRPRLLFRRTLSFGSSGKDVELLYKLLNKDLYTHTAPQGLWSPGYVHNHFGNDMKGVVQRFQKKYGIFSQNDERYGTVERKTKKMIRKVFANDPDYLREFQLLQAKVSRRRRPIKFKLEERHFSWRKKNQFLFMFEFMGCNILKASRRAHVSNTSYYNWYKSDPEFVAKVKAIQEERAREMGWL